MPNSQPMIPSTMIAPLQVRRDRPESHLPYRVDLQCCRCAAIHRASSASISDRPAWQSTWPSEETRHSKAGGRSAVVFRERHLRHLLLSYMKYYNGARTHLSLESRAPSIAPGTFFVAQPWADCITNMPGFNLRQAQVRLPILGDCRKKRFCALTSAPCSLTWYLRAPQS